MKSRQKKRHMRFFFSKDALAMLAGLLAFTACTSVPEPPPPESTIKSAYEEGVPGGVIVNTIDVSARVKAVDKTNRKVTLLGSDGKTFTVKVGPEAVNFEQVEVGDLVNLTVTEELVIYLDEEGASGTDGSAALVALAPKGSQPSGLVAGTVQVTGTVTAIDLMRRTATLQFGDGSVRTFPVRDDVDLSQRKVGEQVVFRVTEMIAISVEKQ